MNEMIFAFECKVDDSWEEQFRSGEHDTLGACGQRPQRSPKGEHKFWQMNRWS
jgi:hypothetical protein